MRAGGGSDDDSCGGRGRRLSPQCAPRARPDSTRHAQVFNESALDAADYAIYRGGQLGIRFVVPLTDNWRYYHGGKHHFVDWTGGGNEDTFYTSAAAVAAFKSYIRHRLAHVNPYTNRSAGDEPAILAWETGNELQTSTAAWGIDIATFIKSLAPNALVMVRSGGAG